jgi:hypothetical protein
MDLRLRASPEVIKDYMHLFVNRRAYTVQSIHPHPETGRQELQPDRHVVRGRRSYPEEFRADAAPGGELAADSDHG